MCGYRRPKNIRDILRKANVPPTARVRKGRPQQFGFTTPLTKIQGQPQSTLPVKNKSQICSNLQYQPYKHQVWVMQLMDTNLQQFYLGWHRDKTLQQTRVPENLGVSTS